MIAIVILLRVLARMSWWQEQVIKCEEFYPFSGRERASTSSTEPSELTFVVKQKKIQWSSPECLLKENRRENRKLNIVLVLVLVLHSIVHPSLDLNCSIASDVTAAMLLVKNKRNSKLFFHVNSSRKNSFVLTPNMAALSRGCKPRILCVCSLERNTGTVSTDERDACTTYVRYTSHL